MALAIYSAVSGWQASVFPLARSMAIKLALVLPCRASASSGHCERSLASAVRIVSANVGSASGSDSGSEAAGGSLGAAGASVGAGGCEKAGASAGVSAVRAAKARCSSTAPVPMSKIVSKKHSKTGRTRLLRRRFGAV